MIDRITLVADNLSDKDIDPLLHPLPDASLGFGCKVSADGQPLYYDARYRGLYYKLRRTTRVGWRLSISGSVKNFRNGENYSFMGFDQTTEALYQIAATVGLHPTQFRVTSLEVSVPVVAAPIDKLVKSYGQREFMPMPVPPGKSGMTGKSYGVSATSSYAYTSIKLYRKNEEQAIHFGRIIGQCQQVEFCIDKARFLRIKLNKAGIASDCPLKTGVSLNDLTKPEVQLLLCGLLTDIPLSLTLKTDEMPTPDYNSILPLMPGKKPEEKLQQLIAFAESRNYRQRVKEQSRSRFFELQKLYDDLRDQLCPASDKELHKFQQALAATVETGKPTSPVSSIIYTGKQSSKQVTPLVQPQLTTH
ncbi:hypothetical protein K3G63_22475 [Hymenobacter sp. HSC-4F20]|uniref:hypothetical protein n=1 Tax=Hymenobacter sp. HSC-4F20 TaxID=2864135 RepID=UPI001C7390CC|nr:hypothetical protein [Hymenobacter sp. HSC-4F20]MBX0293227.1 hypothetical protein [Hymenobacter sp. HSC-4F20]